MSREGPIRPPSPHWVGGAEGMLLQYQTEQNLRQKCGMFICQLTASQTFDHFLPELKVVAFCV